MRRILLLAAVLLSLHSIKSALAASCPDLKPEDRTRLELYIAKKYHIPDKVKIRLEYQSAINDLCYRKLAFRGQGPLGKMELKLYASPDLRFLSTDVMDSSIDPSEKTLKTQGR